MNLSTPADARTPPREAIIDIPLKSIKKRGKKQRVSACALAMQQL